MTEMCSASTRADALNALTLVENIAKLATQGLFGFVFAALAQIGKPHLTFFANAVSSHSPSGCRQALGTHNTDVGNCTSCIWHFVAISLSS